MSNRSRWSGLTAKIVQAKRRRRRNMHAAVSTLFGLLLVSIALILLFVRQRIHEVETQFAQLLQDTVKAEVAALRIGDLNSFLNVQDSVDADWMNHQRLMFQRYSDLKSSGAIELTGSILAVDIAGSAPARWCRKTSMNCLTRGCGFTVETAMAGGMSRRTSAFGASPAGLSLLTSLSIIAGPITSSRGSSARLCRIGSPKAVRFLTVGICPS